MLRIGAPRAILRVLNSTASHQARNSITSRVNTTASKLQFTSKLCTLSKNRPLPNGLVPFKPVTAALVRRATTQTPYDKIDKKAEEEIAHKKLEAHPEAVSSTSSIHPVFHEVRTPDPEPDPDMMAGVRGDLKTIRETFSLQEVPREAYVLGLAGVLPYLATSITTVYCSWEINHANATGLGFLMSGKSAELLLHVLEPIQIGYGAVIISFLGAIHWGLEWAGYGGQHGYRRYAIGVFAPAVAWPTTFLPPLYALIAQFLAFNILYYADSRAAKRGWAPPWYGVYRFVLTFIVGASIVISIIGRGHIGDQVNHPPSPVERIQAFKYNAAQSLMEEEEAARAKMVAEDEAKASASKDEDGSEGEGASEDEAEKGSGDSAEGEGKPESGEKKSEGKDE